MDDTQAVLTPEESDSRGDMASRLTLPFESCRVRDTLYPQDFMHLAASGQNNVARVHCFEQ